MATGPELMAAASYRLRKRVSVAWCKRRQVQAWCRGGPEFFRVHSMFHADALVREAIRRVRDLQRNPYLGFVC